MSQSARVRVECDQYFETVVYSKGIAVCATTSVADMSLDHLPSGRYSVSVFSAKPLKAEIVFCASTKRKNPATAPVHLGSHAFAETHFQAMADVAATLVPKPESGSVVSRPVDLRPTPVFTRVEKLEGKNPIQIVALPRDAIVIGNPGRLVKTHQDVRYYLSSDADLTIVFPNVAPESAIVPRPTIFLFQ